MESRTLKLLEFPKLLKLLAQRAVSEAGAGACLELAPLEDEKILRREILLVDQAMTWLAETEFSLSPFEDLSGLFTALENPLHTLDLDDIWGLSQTMSLANEAREAARPGRTNAWELLTEEAEMRPWPAKAWSALSRCVGQDGRLRDEASPELFSVRQEIRRINQACTRKVKDFLKSGSLADILQDEFMTVSSDRYVLPVKTNFKGRIQGIVHDYSQTGETCYVEPLFLVELNNDLAELRQEERAAEREVLRMLTGLVRQELDQVGSAYAFLVRLDVLQAKASLAADMAGRMLPVEGRGGVDLRAARHPLLVLGSGAQEPLVQAVDIRLGKDEFALIISGGNAGGKTVCLKTLGLISLMAQAAVPVPVEAGSSMPRWSNIFAFLGDEQSIEDHLSTFSAQISQLTRIWDGVDEASLVILDEFGAGTDPAQGAALAQAVVESLMERGARVAVATHFPALKTYGLSREGIRSASVIFDPRTKKPLFQLAYDQVGASIALDVAREHGLPKVILEKAEQYLLGEGEETSAVLDRLNELAVVREKELADLKAERERLEARRARLADSFEREKRELLESVKGEAQSIVRQWKEGKVGRKKAQKELAETREKLAREMAAEQEAAEVPRFDPGALAAGDSVFYTPWGKSGVVRERDDRKGQVKVDLDGVTLWVPMADLAQTPVEDASGKTGRSRGSTPKTSGAVTPGRDEGLTMKIDLRGSRADAAVADLMKFLDRVVLGGGRRAEIIHGRGTGALRREVHEALRSFPPVESFHLAPEDQGGDGKTVVELK